MAIKDIVQGIVDRSYMGMKYGLMESINDGQVLITESGVIGGDMLPRSAMEPTRNKLQEIFQRIGDRNGDEVEVRFVGSTSYGVGGSVNKSFFGDIDVILHVGKPETLSQIKTWILSSTENVRDINTRKSGPDLEVDQLGNEFSFLFPIYKDNDDRVTIGELRFAMQSRMSDTTWKSNHDERLKLESNLDNVKDRHGPAMVQVDVIRTIVDGQEIESMMEQARSLSGRLEELSQDVDAVDSLSDYKEWLDQFLDKGDVEEFESHYKYLKGHGKLQSVEDQRLMTALHYLSSQDGVKDAISNRMKGVSYRYSFHPDALQMIHYIASQLGVKLDDSDFGKSGVDRLIRRAEKAGILREPKTENKDGGQLSPAEIKRLQVDMLRDPTKLNEALGFFTGKHKGAVRSAIATGTRNKRPNETNPNALFRNYGSRNIMRV